MISYNLWCVDEMRLLAPKPLSGRPKGPKMMSDPADDPMEISDDDQVPDFLRGDPELGKKVFDLNFFSQKVFLVEIWKQNHAADNLEFEESSSPGSSGKKSRKKKPKPTFYQVFLDEKGIQHRVPVAYGATQKGEGDISLSKDEALQMWRGKYGPFDSALCKTCDVVQINRSSVTSNLAHVNPKCKGGVGNKIWSVFYQCAECNQTGEKKTRNLFDQLLPGRQDKVILVASILFDFYCQAEVGVNFTFKGLADFVEKIYGRGPLIGGSVESGIEDERVFQILRNYDRLHPMPEIFRNPARRAHANVKKHWTLLENLNENY